MEFSFPQSMQAFHTVKDVASLETLIQQENTILSSNINYRCLIRKTIYLYAHCKQRKCPSFLTFRLNQQTFQLVKYGNIHNHSYQSVRSTQYLKIQQELIDLPSTVTTQSAKLHICSKFKISERCFYYLHQKIRNKKMSYLQLFEDLNQKQYQLHTDPFYHGMNQLPDVMIIVTPLMKENFKKFGNWMGFDFTFNLVQEIKEGKQQYRLGVFVGISASKKIVPFGLVLCNEQTKERYYQILKSFSDIMNRFPEIIITDQDKAIISAIQTLKEERQFEGHHLLDCFHILRNVRKHLSNKQCWKFFNSLIRQKSQSAFKQTVSQCISVMEGERDIQLLKRFLQSSDRYCFGKAPAKLFGFMPNTAMNEKIHDLIKTIIPYSKPFTVVVKKVLLLLEEMGLKCHEYQIENTKHEITFFYPPLKEIRYSVCKKIFKQILNEFSKGLHHEVILYQQDKCIIREGQGQQFKLNRNEEKWSCQCAYLQKTGIFCSHLSKLVLVEKDRLIDYIHPRWILSIQASHDVRKRYCYQKKTRRNRK